MCSSSHFVTGQKLRQSEQVHYHGGETNPLNYTFQVIHGTQFRADATKCKCSNVGLQFALLEQIHNALLCEC